MEPNLTAIYEILLEQHKAIRDARLQVESLKAMMFDHRPAFRESFAQQVEIVSASEPLRQFDAQIAALEQSLTRLRQ
ncbi:MAG TPA: hypothetical protein VN622_08140 [Clostridia bacterium]|nr:hypothetical protein [Clostridia bacterium]